MIVSGFHCGLMHFLLILLMTSDSFSSPVRRVFLGWRLALLTIFAASLAGSLVGLLLVALRGQTLETRLAFGTFLGFGAAAALFLGLPFLSWYLGNIR